MVEARFKASAYGAVIGLEGMGGRVMAGVAAGPGEGGRTERERHSITADFTLLRPETMSANRAWVSVFPLALARISSIFLNCSTVSIGCEVLAMGGCPDVVWRDARRFMGGSGLGGCSVLDMPVVEVAWVLM